MDSDMGNAGQAEEQDMDHDGTHQQNSSSSDNGVQALGEHAAGSQEQAPGNEQEPEAAQPEGPSPRNRLGAAAAEESNSRYYTRMSADGNRKRKKAVDPKDRKIMRSGELYLVADWNGRLKPGKSNSASQGHRERIMGKPQQADWGFSMAKSETVSLGACTFQESEIHLNIFEFIPLLGFRDFLIHPRHEVCFAQPELFSLL